MNIIGIRCAHMEAKYIHNRFADCITTMSHSPNVVVKDERDDHSHWEHCVELNR